MHYVRQQVNTKSLLGRPALIEMLQEKDQSHERSQQDLTGKSSPDRQEQKGFSFNNNIYNNYNPDHAVDTEPSSKRLLSKADQQRVDIINSLKQAGTI